ncbi:MAG: hypothetical protein HYZ53_08305 [Planctomycetes bacterium]|nr:hypothetical protein [Planctomycetota bacterium]
MARGPAGATLRILATLPPYVDHRRFLIEHPLVDELRFNSISPLAESRRDLLARLRRECGAKRLWLDLKGRQLRIARFAYLPYAYVQLSHRIRVDLPVDVYFKDCVARAVEVVGGDKLILARRPVRVVGEGEPINILHPSLEVEGYLTESDREFVAAARELGLHDYLLSFAERPEDVAELTALDPDARVVAKIESRRGIDFVRGDYARVRDRVRLMAARDDLYIQMGAWKSDYLPALEAILRADPDAFVASRLLTSLEEAETVSSQDLSDFWLMLRLGYRSFMLSDTLCFREEGIRRALAVLEELFDGGGGAAAATGGAHRGGT